MRIALVSPYPDIANFGLRSLSAFLKQQGHETRFLALPDRSCETATRPLPAERYPARSMAQVRDAVRGCDLVGLSVMTPYVDAARQVTRMVHDDLGVPVVWGGFHPSVRPAECLDHADFVVVGEGEHALAGLVRCLEEDGDPIRVPGLAFRRGGALVTPPLLPLEQDLDRFPPPDWSLEGHFLLQGERLVPASPVVLREALAEASVSRHFGRVGYQTLTSRGCPHACTYCGNSFLRTLYAGQPFVRFRSVEHVLEELEGMRRALPFVDLTWLSDDSFFARPLPDVRRFADGYRRRIGLPLYLLGSPATVTAPKVAAMVEAGAMCIQMGIEHGSPRIRAMFGRSDQGDAAILEAARILAAHAQRSGGPRTAPPHYDVIYDVPGETLDDRLATLRLVARLPRPYRLQVFALVLYPGTALYSEAVARGFIQVEKAEDRTFFERHDSYANTLLFLARTGRFPSALLTFLAQDDVARVLTGRALAPAGKAARVALRAARRIHREAGRIETRVRALERRVA